jgi:hypothetical protein
LTAQSKADITAPGKGTPMPTLRLLPELEDSLRQIPGITAASVVTGPDAVPTEVHVLAAPGKAAKQVVRDVQSMALVRYDIDIDHRIVSVVQIGDDVVEALPLADPQAAVEGPDAVIRPAISAIMVRSGGGLTEASVTLAAGDLLFEGKAAGPAGQSNRSRIVAIATLDSLRDLLGQTCEVESASVVSTGIRELAISVLTLMVPRTGEQVLTGCALVRGDEADAVSRSVLAALNRQLTG